MERINALLSGAAMPLLLLICGISFSARLRFFFIFRPRLLFRSLKEGARAGGISPVRALSQALAGTLGIGNMTGVAAAISAGGAGAVFWMWISALFAMSIKYFEVALAVYFRKKSPDGYYGGAMYYIKEIFFSSFPRLCTSLAVFFSLLSIGNSLITGNLLQIHSASRALPPSLGIWVGVLSCAFALPIILGKAKRVSATTLALIPFLSALYTLLCLIVIIPRLCELPAVFAMIFRSAFSFRAVGGGALGYGILRAVRFGTVRGILSNEAGCGTSPTAHASANAKSPHHQGCFGIFEVFADTVVLCTLTALVILLSGGDSLPLEAMELTLFAFESLSGKLSSALVSASAMLFAFSTLICQCQYGEAALFFITKKKAPRAFYIFLTLAVCISAPIVSPNLMWQWADLIIALMTLVNLSCLWYAEKKGFFEKLLPPALSKKREK